LTTRIKISDIVLLVVCGLIVTVIAVVIDALLHATPFSLKVIDGAVNGACWIFGYQFLSRRRGWISLRARFSPVGGKILAASAGIAVGLILLYSAVTDSLQWLGIKMVVIPPDVLTTAHGDQWPFFLLFGVIFAPAAEELMFRGLLLDWLRQKMAAWRAVLIVSLVFAFVHDNNLRSGVTGWLELGDRFLIGVAASFLALRYKSLRPPFVLHATNNCLVAVLIFVDAN
jgi:membrane protease YdiL (CAAX protease family)